MATDEPLMETTNLDLLVLLLGALGGLHLLLNFLLAGLEGSEELGDEAGALLLLGSISSSSLGGGRGSLLGGGGSLGSLD